MTYNFVLPCQAFSVNAYRYKQGFAKTKEAKLYEERILGHLEEHKQLYDIADAFKERGGTLEVHIVCSYPHHIFYNQSKQVSAKTLDCSNVEKPLLDLVINNFMGLDDRFVTKLVSEKVAGVGHSIEITVSLFQNS